MHRRLVKIENPLTLSLLIAVASVKVCSANSEQRLSLEIKSFNDGNYSQTVSLGKTLATSEPANALALYYYAQALAKLNRNDEAIAQFTACYKIAKDSKIKSYSLIALQNLNKNSSNLPTAGNATSMAPSAATQTNLQSDASSQTTELSTLKLKIFEAGNQQIKALREQADRDIQAAKNKAAEQMQGIPQYLNRRYYVNGVNTGLYPNQDYPEAFEKSQAELSATTKQINAAFAKRESEIMAECKRRSSGYDQVQVGMHSQEKPGTTAIQLTPEHTNTYLRQYVNYDGSVPGALKARAGALERSGQLRKNETKTTK